MQTLAHALQKSIAINNLQARIAHLNVEIAHHQQLKEAANTERNNNCSSGIRLLSSLNSHISVLLDEVAEVQKELATIVDTQHDTVVLAFS